MGKSVSFVVPGKPFAKQRPRTTMTRGFVATYTPLETVQYENFVKQIYMYEVGEKLEGGIKAEITAAFPIPKSTSKKKREQMLNGEIPYTKKCDCDNIAKSILDSLNKIAYDDDSQVCELRVVKKYGEEPNVSVKLTEI